jgi:hypothetical protein
MLLSLEDGTETVPSLSEENSTFSISSDFSSKRMAAKVDRIFKDCNKTNARYLDVPQR